MAFKKGHLKDLTERTLKEIGLYSENAVNLLLGTCAQESLFGTYLKQLGMPLGKGGAGIMQIERATFEDLKRRYAERFPIIKEARYEELEYNLKLSIVVARLKYLSVPDLIPGDLNGQAAMWKKVYNTYLGSGTVEEYKLNYDKYVTHGN